VAVAVGVAAPDGIIVILKITMQRIRLQVVAVVADHGRVAVVRVVRVKLVVGRRGRLVITGVEPVVDHRLRERRLADTAGVPDSMARRHLHNQVIRVMAETSTLDHLALEVQMGKYGKAIGTVGTSIKDYTLDLI
jgi:hypothetical protein